MTILDRVKRMTSLVIDVPHDIEKLSVIIETKTATAESALKREAVALEKAMTPELEAELEKLETLLSHIPGLAGLVKAHDVPAPAQPAAAPVAAAPVAVQPSAPAPSAGTLPAGTVL